MWRVFDGKKPKDWHAVGTQREQSTETTQAQYGYSKNGDAFRDIAMLIRIKKKMHIDTLVQHKEVHEHCVYSERVCVCGGVHILACVKNENLPTDFSNNMWVTSSI